MDTKQWYLIGPMSNCYYEAMKWREDAKKYLSCIDPYEEETGLKVPAPYKNLFEYYKALRGEGKFDKIRSEFQQILQIDIASVDRAFGMLCYEPYPQDVSSWGTIKEATRAYIQGKPIVVWSEVPDAKKNFTMITMSTAITGTLEDAILMCLRLEREGHNG